MVLSSEVLSLTDLKTQKLRNLSVGEPYKKLHQLDKDCRAAYVDKHFEIFLSYNEIGDNGCNSQNHEKDVQYVPYFIGIHRLSLFDYFFFQSSNNLVGIGNNTTEASEVFYLYFTINSQADIFNHLSGI